MTPEQLDKGNKIYHKLSQLNQFLNDIELGNFSIMNGYHIHDDVVEKIKVLIVDDLNGSIDKLKKELKGV